jgi:predicted DsbA family dithiol-disulfide isomerase
VGKRRLEKAIAQFGDRAHFSVVWRPFFLNPDLPAEGVPKLEYYHHRFGKARVESMIPHMKQVGQEEGIEFEYGGVIGNTMDAHRLMEWALQVHGEKVQNDLSEQLMRAYFEKNENVANRSILLRCVKDAGLDEKVGADVLDGDQYRKEVKEMANKHARVINGVPFFNINNRIKFSGAQPVEQFLFVFDELTEND